MSAEARGARALMLVFGASCMVGACQANPPAEGVPRSSPAGSGGESSIGGSPAGQPPNAGVNGGQANAPAVGGVATSMPSVAGEGGATPQRPRAPVGAIGKFEPPDGKTLLVIGQDSGSIDEYSAQVGVVPAGIMFYTSISTLAGVSSAIDYGAGVQDLQHWNDLPQQLVIQCGLYLVGALDRMVSGSLDGNIATLAAALKQTQRPVFLRIGYEFDADWTGYQPDVYRSAFQHLVTRFRDEGADNVVYVWHAWGYEHSFGQASVDAWYPGDDYVDWVGVSLFPPWDAASAQAADGARAELSAFARSHAKPFMIAESAPKQDFAPSQGQAAWQGWYEPIFDFIEANDVKLFSYINADWESQPLWAGQGWGDTRVQTNQYVLDHWNAKLGHARFLHASQDLYGVLSD